MAHIAAERSEVTGVAPVPVATNPAPLGLSAFAVTAFILSAQAAGFYKAPEIVLGLALFYGGLMQVISAIQAFKVGNVFAATAFGSFAAFWLSFAAIFIPGFGVVAAYLGPKGTGGADFATAVGFFMLAWFIFTTYLVLASLKTTVTLIVAFFLAWLTFLVFAIGYLMAGSGADASTILKVGGWVGIALAVSAWYAAASFLLAEMGGPIRLPIGHRG